MKLQTTGQKQPLKSEPRNTLPEFHAKPEFQFVGDKIKLQTEPSSVKYGANTPNGTMQLIGDSLKLNKTPRQGYDSASTPMSNRAEDKKGY